MKTAATSPILTAYRTLQDTPYDNNSHYRKNTTPLTASIRHITNSVAYPSAPINNRPINNGQGARPAADRPQSNASLSLISNEKKIHIDAKNYVFLGSCSGSSINDMGISLDQDGRLMVISGRPHDLLSGLYRKYVKDGKPNNCYIVDSNMPKLDALFIDKNGQLIGKYKGSNRFYAIALSLNPRTYSDVDSKNNNNDLTARLTYADYEYDITESLTFKSKHGNAMTLAAKDGKLFLAKYASSANKSECDHDMSMLEQDIKLPIKEKYQVVSIKRALDKIQIEIACGDKRRIVYLDPTHISLTRFSAKRISHKPPHNLYTCIGGDPHEKYDPGQPFSSTRLGNFSSKHIPFVSSVIDNFRVHVKKAKLSHAEGDHAGTLSHIAKSIDPGVRGVISATKGIGQTLQEQTDETKDSAFNKNIRNIEQNYGSLLAELPDQLVQNKTIADGITELLDKIGPNDAIRLDNTSAIFAFFGIAMGGVPFVPGWFAGLLCSITDSHNLTLTKTANNKIRLQFVNRLNSVAVGLLGTGQGLEKPVSNQLNTDFLTVLPVEANIILAMTRNSENNFAFDMDPADFKNMVTDNTDPKEREILIDHAIMKAVEECGLALSVEAKSEFRIQAGRMVNPDTYMVTPRFGVGLRIALHLFSLNKSKESTIAAGELQFKTVNENTILRALTMEAAGFLERKIMPIAMVPYDDSVLCFPLPLTEEANEKPIKTPALFKHKWEKNQRDVEFEKSFNAFINDTAQTNHGFIGIDPVVFDRASKAVAKLHEINAKSDLVYTADTLNKIKLTRTMQHERAHFLQKRLSQLNVKMYPSNKTMITNPNTNRLKSDLKDQNTSPFIDALKALKHDLVSREKSNMDRALDHQIIAKYEIFADDQQALNELEQELYSTIKSSVNQDVKISCGKIEKIHADILALKDMARYRLNTIEIKSTGSLSKSKSTIPAVNLGLKNKKTLSYTKHQGEIDFSYSKSNQLVPEKITSTVNHLRAHG